MTTSEVRMKFQNGSIYSLSDDDLKEVMKCLATEGVRDEITKPTAQIQATAILHLQNQRLIHSLEDARKITEKWFMVLAIGSLIIGGLSLLVQVLSELRQIGVITLYSKI